MEEGHIDVREAHGQYTVDVSFAATDSVVDTIALSVAAIRGCDPTELPPLGSVVDADALESLFTSSNDGTDVNVGFEYAGFDVSVSSDGEITFVEQS